MAKLILSSLQYQRLPRKAKFLPGGISPEEVELVQLSG